MQILRYIPINTPNKLNRCPRLLPLRRALPICNIKLAIPQYTQHLIFPLLSVLDVLRDTCTGVFQYGAVSWITTACGDAVAHPVQALEVGF
jgi:hypothetical protein